MHWVAATVKRGPDRDLPALLRFIIEMVPSLHCHMGVAHSWPTTVHVLARQARNLNIKQHPGHMAYVVHTELQNNNKIIIKSESAPESSCKQTACNRL